MPKIAPVTVTQPEADVQRVAASWVHDAARLDDALFEPHGWFPIDRVNQRPRGVVVATRTAGLDLVASSDVVAAIVGKLRRPFVVVDIDVEGPLGTTLAQQLAAWCTDHSLWHLVRPSGGAPGRHHVFLRPAGHHQDLFDLLDLLRTAHRLAAKRLEVRRQVRPLTSPHRHGSLPRPRGRLTDARSALGPDATPPSPPTAPAAGGIGTGRRPPADRARADSTTALTPAPRRRRDLPEPWARYLATGQCPPIGGTDTGPSTEGLRLTHELLLAGHSAEEAWSAIVAAHPAALRHTRAAYRGRTWWTQHVWNHLVADDHHHRATHSHLRAAPISEASPALLAAVATARASLTSAQWAWGPVQRHSIVQVAHTLLDRMVRTGQATVPCPQRDLVLDTGRSRPTIKAALDALHGVLGTLLETFDPSDRETSSHSFALAESFLDSKGVGLDLPPVSHTPLPAGTWKVLGPFAHSLWRVLPTDSSAAAVEQLASEAGLTPYRGGVPSPEQVRTVRTHLGALARQGLAICDDSGRWTAGTHVAPGLSDEATEALAPLTARVADERATYRSAPGARWRHERDAAHHRDRVAAQRRHATWAGTLSPAARRARSAQLARAFHAAAVEHQAMLKDHWAQQRRRRLAPTEAERHDTWCEALSSPDYTRRVIERTAAFSRLHSAEQAARAQAWRDHRTRWTVPQGHPGDRTRRPFPDTMPTLAPGAPSVRPDDQLQLAIA